MRSSKSTRECYRAKTLGGGGGGSSGCSSRDAAANENVSRQTPVAVVNNGSPMAACAVARGRAKKVSKKNPSKQVTEIRVRTFEMSNMTSCIKSGEWQVAVSNNKVRKVLKKVNWSRTVKKQARRKDEQVKEKPALAPAVVKLYISIYIARRRWPLHCAYVCSQETKSEEV